MVSEPEPLVVAPPGLLVRVQEPEAGSPVNMTLPVAIMHVGWIMVPTLGAPGVTGWVLISTEAEETEVQPPEFLTV